MRRANEPRAGCGQSLAGCRDRALQHAAVPHQPGILAQVVPGPVDHRIVPRAVPQLVLQPAGDGNGGRSEPAFLANFGFATLLAEDGRPMHKSWGNSIEFNEAADKMGVDVMRWLYATQKPENDLLFGYHRGDEARRQFLLPLWNAYSFFVTYANLDGWNAGFEFDPDYPGGHRAQQ